MLCRLDSDLHLTMDTTWTSKVHERSAELMLVVIIVRSTVTLSVCDASADAAADRLEGAHVPPANGSGGA
jgi:hypothetical protein